MKKNSKDNKEASKAYVVTANRNNNKRNPQTRQNKTWGNQNSKTMCYRCGDTRHTSKECKGDFTKVECRGCGKKGHLQKACQAQARQNNNKQSGANAPKNRRGNNNIRKARRVKSEGNDADSSSDSSEEEYYDDEDNTVAYANTIRDEGGDQGLLL